MNPKKALPWSFGILLGAVLLILGLQSHGTIAAQDNPDKDKDHSQHQNKPSGDQNLATQIAELRAKVERLQAAVEKSNPGTPPGLDGMGAMKGKGMGEMQHKGTSAMQDKDMGAMQDKGTGTMQDKGMDMTSGKGAGPMEGMDSKKGGMKGMDSKTGGMEAMKGAASGMSMEGAEDGMDMMGMIGTGVSAIGGMKGMGKIKMASALPGLPGASHLYHIGATGYFLDHPETLALSTEQQSALNGIKEKALLGQFTMQRKIESGEQELWELTAAGEPDAGKIEAKVREIEKLRGDPRLLFIRAVGEAAKVLTDDQRRALLGVTQPQSAPHSSH
jgi:Spy/CpxP family protein refolding chaperone